MRYLLIVQTSEDPDKALKMITEYPELTVISSGICNGTPQEVLWGQVEPKDYPEYAVIAMVQGTEYHLDQMRIRLQKSYGRVSISSSEEAMAKKIRRFPF